MNRFKRELISRGIIYENEDRYGEARSLVAVTDKYIICIWGCLVLPPEIHLFNKRNLKPIGAQLLIPERKIFSEGTTWQSYTWEEESK